MGPPSDQRLPPTIEYLERLPPVWDHPLIGRQQGGGWLTKELDFVSNYNVTRLLICSEFKRKYVFGLRSLAHNFLFNAVPRRTLSVYPRSHECRIQIAV